MWGGGGGWRRGGLRGECARRRAAIGVLRRAGERKHAVHSRNYTDFGGKKKVALSSQKEEQGLRRDGRPKKKRLALALVLQRSRACLAAVIAHFGDRRAWRALSLRHRHE